jgi:predicted DsbA family dithiol-disulfide isomerase
VIADEREAARLGLNAVPAFVANRKAALSGVQPVENLKRLVKSVRVGS